MKINTDRCDIAVIGGGILGIATAMRLAREYPRYKVVVLEKEAALARHQTGHNSGVIHAGIYYAPGSQKANLCTIGSRMLRRFCDERGISYEMCGKVVVATNEGEMSGLEELMRRGEANGAEGLQLIGSERLKELEPHAAGVGAIHSPNTGIIDFTAVTHAYAVDLAQAGGKLHTETKVLKVTSYSSEIIIETNRGDIQTKYVVNCAGLHSDVVARSMGVDLDLRIIPFRGEYFSLSRDRSNLVRGLIYPVPDPGLPFLGVHFTKRISGGIEAGPNAVLALDREGYSKTSVDFRDALDTLRYPGFWRMSLTHWRTGFKEQYRSLFKSAFLRSLQALVPEVQMDDLTEPGAGVRAQAVDRYGNLLQDFEIAYSPNAIHVLNAPSPAATASLAISRRIVDQASEAFELAA
jgi:L-2-hydroxyglutarate oxidase LhgO